MRRARGQAWVAAATLGLALAAMATTLAHEQAASAKRALLGEYVRVSRALEQWRMSEARSLLLGLTQSSPEAPETQFFVAKLAFYEGRYEEALRGLHALQNTSARELVTELLPLVEGTLAVTRGFAQKEFAHFVIHYLPGKDEVLVDVAADALESAYAAIGNDLGHFPDEKIRVELLPKAQSLAELSTLTEVEIMTSGTIALCKYNKLMVVSPRALLFGYPWLDTMAHELTHYIVAQATSDGAPIWFHEGVAKFEETRWRARPGQPGLGAEYQHVLAAALGTGKLIGFDKMHPSMAKLPSQTAAATAFAEVYTMIAFVQSRAGYDGLRAVLARIREGKSARRAVAEVMGKPWEEVEADWKIYLGTLALTSLPADLAYKAHATYRFRKGDEQEDNVGIERVRQQKAQKFARLGGILRSRNLLAAAALEYKKALAASGPRDTFVAAKLARTYLEMGEPREAADLAKRLVKVDPDDAHFRATLGAAYAALGDHKGARTELEAALRVSPFDPSVRCGLAESYQALGQKALALREAEACSKVR